MVKKIVRTSYACSVCGREWPKPELAQACEASPGPILVVGDVVIWNGVRDDEYQGLQTLVYDVVTEIEIEERFDEPGHEVIYRLGKQHSVRADEIHDARTGYVNLAGNVGLAQLHTDRIGTALRESSASRVDRLLRCLRRGGLPLQPRLGRLYQPLRELEYSHTWSASAHRYGLRRLPADTAQVLDWIARQPSDDDCLAFIGGWAHDHRGRRPHPNLDEAFDFNHFNTWGALVGYDLDEAFQLLATTPDRELIARVRGYRAGLLAGATLGGRQVPQGLFRLDEAKASGAWPREVLSWVRARGPEGSGLTRLRRVYEAAIDLSAIEPEATVTVKPMTMWADKEVLFVLAGKGGVGKCVAADTLVTNPETGAWMRIEDVVTESTTHDIVTFDGAHIAIAPIAQKIRSGIKSCVRVEFASGRTLTATPSHPLLTAAGWQPISALQVGQTVALAHLEPEPIHPEHLENAELDILAVLLAEGSCTSTTNRFTTFDQDILAIMQRAATSLGMSVTPK